MIINWKTIKWSRVTSRVRRLQNRIYKASLSNKREKVHFLQKKLIYNLYAKLVSVICNIALYGIENNLKEWIQDQKWFSKRKLYLREKKKKPEKQKKKQKDSILLVPYADDFIISHPNEEITISAKEETSEWLSKTSKLSFNETKTRIFSVKFGNGFNFLGHSFIKIFNKQKKTYRIKIYPTKENQKRLIKNVGEICRKYRAISSYDLIQILRPKIIGWANYYRYCECSDTFKKMDHFIFRILRSWVFRRARKKGRLSIKEKYFPSGRTYFFDNRKFSDNWILYGKKRGKNGEILENFLPRLSWVKSIKHRKVRGGSSVYDGNHIYWINRLSKYPSFNSRIRKLKKR